MAYAFFLIILIISFYYCSIFLSLSLSLFYIEWGRKGLFLVTAEEKLELVDTKFIQDACMLCKHLLGTFA